MSPTSRLAALSLLTLAVAAWMASGLIIGNDASTAAPDAERTDTRAERLAVSVRTSEARPVTRVITMSEIEAQFSIEDCLDGIERMFEEMADEDEGISLPRVGNFTRNHYYNTTPKREGVGRTRIASGPDGEDPRRT
jgi:hypothetical protein